MSYSQKVVLLDDTETTGAGEAFQINRRRHGRYIVTVGISDTATVELQARQKNEDWLTLDTCEDDDTVILVEDFGWYEVRGNVMANTGSVRMVLSFNS